MLVHNGRVIQDHLDKVKISMAELEAAIREHGVETVAEVDLAVLESDGNISILSENFRKRSVRRRKAHKVLSQTN